MKLLTTQKNVFYDVIVEEGLSPNLFEIKEFPERATLRPITKFVYSKSDFYFQIYLISKDTTLLHFAPGRDSYSEQREPLSFESIVNHFRTWVNCLSLETSAIDKWKRLDEEMSQIQVSYSDDEGKFSASEYVDLQSQMLLLKNSIKQIGFLPEQLTVIESKIDHLTIIAQDLSKFDWKGLFVGTMMSVVIQLGVTPENASALWDAIKFSFKKYFLLP